MKWQQKEQESKGIIFWCEKNHELNQSHFHNKTMVNAEMAKDLLKFSTEQGIVSQSCRRRMVSSQGLNRAPRWFHEKNEIVTGCRSGNNKLKCQKRSLILSLTTWMSRQMTFQLMQNFIKMFQDRKSLKSASNKWESALVKSCPTNTQ